MAAFAFYMLERFQASFIAIEFGNTSQHYYVLANFVLTLIYVQAAGEPIPDFFNPVDWYNIKLLSAGGIPDGHQQHRTQSLTSRTQIDTASSVMRSCEVFSSKVTHSGRHARTTEAYHLGLSLDHIQHLGRWVMDQMEAFYAPKSPITGAFYMAHFNKTNGPYCIERDLVMPPLELQRLSKASSIQGNIFCLLMCKSMVKPSST